MPMMVDLGVSFYVLCRVGRQLTFLHYIALELVIVLLLVNLKSCRTALCVLL
jgi:hypothetical protein